MTEAIASPWAGKDLFVLAGPCAIESREFALETAEQLREIFVVAGVGLVYKSSFDKANRTSASSFRGVGIDAGLAILTEIRETLGVPVITDVHDASQVVPAAEAVDMLQTPSFLCRQSDFIAAVAAAGKPVNIKKGQFLAPWDMAKVIEKARIAASEAGVAPDFFVCERGSTFGYGNLVVDMRGLTIMRETSDCPVIFDATHSVQLPGAKGESSGGERHHAPALARAAVATGAVSGVFMETHPDPDNALCDGPNMLPFEWLPELLAELKAIAAISRSS